MIVHNRSTQTSEKDVAKFPGLVSYKGYFYYRVRIPKDLAGKVKGRHTGWGKNEVKYALGTSDRKEALKLVKFEALKIDQLFDEERRRLNAENGTHQQEKRQVSVLSENEVMRCMTRWFMEQEEDFANWYDETGIDLDSEDKAEVLDTLREDTAAYDGAFLQEGEALDFGKKITALFEGEGIELDKDSEVWKKLNNLMRRGSLELTRRKIDFLQGEERKRYDEFLWRHIQPKLANQKKVSISFGELCKKFIEAQKRAQRSLKTMDSYVAPIRIMKEILGEATLLEDITHEKVGEVADFIKQIPPNATKKFPKMTMRQVVEFAKRENLEPIKPQTAKNYYKNVLAIFNYAVDTRLMQHNPAKDRWLRDSFKFERNQEDISVFTIEELNQLFRAPLYTGCVSDEDGRYYKAGKNTPRRGRFWVPLICLFHGMRMNEACQLWTQDIKEEDGYLCLRLGKTLDKGLAEDKRLKNKGSRRIVPVHPELLKIGFREFVEERRKDRNLPRLFPELELKKGREHYSEKFSDWFADFKKFALGYTPEGKFHSFRHMWRERVTAEEVPVDVAEALGGWWGEKRSAEALYGRGPTTEHKYRTLSKVKYPELDLSHLYIDTITEQ